MLNILIIKLLIEQQGLKKGEVAMYLEKLIDLGDVIEVQRYFNGRIGRKDTRRRAAALRGTPPEQVRWQSKEAIRKVWRLLRDERNFKPGDLWVTLTYKAGTRPDNETVRGDLRELIKRMRRSYRKAGTEFKYILSVGRGKRGAVHIHLVMSRIDTELIERHWQNIVNGGDWVHVHHEHLDRSQNWQKVAAYIVKNGEETFLSDNPIIKRRFSYSRNLHTKKVRARKIKAKAWRKEPAPRKGYYIDKNLSYTGVNQYGYPVQYTVYVRLRGFSPL